jgi:uncharacterized protein with HEPN domain
MENKDLVRFKHMFDVDYDIIWETVNNDLQPLYLQLKMILSDI